MAAQQACGVSYENLPLDFGELAVFPPSNNACKINILAFMSTTMFGEIRGDREMSPANPHEREQSLKFSVYFGLTNFLCVAKPSPWEVILKYLIDPF